MEISMSRKYCPVVCRISSTGLEVDRLAVEIGCLEFKTEVIFGFRARWLMLVRVEALWLRLGRGDLVAK
jgi:hypothetical protein